jgi:NAD(P)-dependent dehydrogenase (short-subunit alcohol dehydrogenase family)
MPAEPSTNQAALITGAFGGIGRALCEAFDSAGYLVVTTDRGQDQPPGHHHIPLDLAALPRNAALQKAFMAKLEAELNGRALHVCVNNAAVQILGHLGEIADEDFQRTFDVNVFAPLVLARLLLPLLEDSGGSIVNIGSIHAKATKPGFVSYATSKSALQGLSQALAVDIGARVRVNTLQPAAVATDMLRAGFADNPQGYAALESYHPVGRIAQPSEIARLAVLLASKDAAFVNGATIDVHGGLGVRLHDPD